MKFWVWDDQAGDSEGPFDLRELGRLEGLNPKSRVCVQGSSEWKPAGEFDALKPLFIKPPSSWNRPKPPPVPKTIKEIYAQSARFPDGIDFSASESSEARRTREPGGSLWSSGLTRVVIAVVVGTALGAGIKRWQNSAISARGDRVKIERNTAQPESVAQEAGVAGEALPKATPDTWAGREREAISFVYNFPVRSALFQQCPASIETAADDIDASGQSNILSFGTSANPARVSSWCAVEIVADGFECARFLPARLMMASVAVSQQMAGVFPGPEAFAKEIRSDIARYQKYEVQVATSWSASQESGPHYRVDLVYRKAGIEPRTEKPFSSQENYLWVVDLAKKTLKPLTGNAWAQVDVQAVAQWVAHVGYPDGFNPDVSDVRGVAPTYSLNSSGTTNSGTVRCAAMGKHDPL